MPSNEISKSSAYSFRAQSAEPGLAPPSPKPDFPKEMEPLKALIANLEKTIQSEA